MRYGFLPRFFFCIFVWFFFLHMDNFSTICWIVIFFKIQNFFSSFLTYFLCLNSFKFVPQDKIHAPSTKHFFSLLPSLPLSLHFVNSKSLFDSYFKWNIQINLSVNHWLIPCFIILGLLLGNTSFSPTLIIPNSVSKLDLWRMTQLVWNFFSSSFYW